MELPQKTEMYCDVLGKGVTCDLIRSAFIDMHADVYKCSRFGLGEPPCKPCSHYCKGIFVPVPDECIGKDGTLNFEAWVKAINATLGVDTEVPVGEHIESIREYCSPVAKDKL